MFNKPSTRQRLSTFEIGLLLTEYDKLLSEGHKSAWIINSFGMSPGSFYHMKNRFKKETGYLPA